MIKKIGVIFIAGIILTQTSGLIVGNAQSVTYENNAVVSFFSPEEEEESRGIDSVGELPKTGGKSSYLGVLGLVTLGLAWTIRQRGAYNRKVSTD